MAINAYTGLMGSGKSYEVVSSVIVPAVIAGRRVVTNIDGIDPDAVRDYCANRKKADVTRLGKVVRVSNTDVMRDGFFPDEDRPEVVSIVQPGDMVAIDEAWEFWSTAHKITVEHQRFFRMHRHYVHPETGVACDVVLMIQSIGDLHRQLRAVVELTFRTKKLKEIGAPRFYRVEMYETNKLTKALLLDTFNKAYDKDVFPLYRSYAGGQGKEQVIDRRQNVFGNRRVWFMCAGVILLWIVCGRLVWKFFNPPVAEPKAAISSQMTSSESTVAADRKPPVPPSSPPLSTMWRITGNFMTDEQSWIILANTAGRLRIEPFAGFTGFAMTLSGTIDGERVTAWSGALPFAMKKEAE